MNICSVDGCDKPVQAKGLCNTHYKRQQRLGNPLAQVKDTKPHMSAPVVTCPVCGREFAARIQHGSRRKKYCSPECRSAASGTGRATNLSWKICECCGERYIAHPSNKKYCNKCIQNGDVQALQYKRTAKYINKKKSGICKQCGKSFTNEYGEKRRDFCSQKCGEIYHDNTLAAKEAKARQARRRRAAKRGVNVEPYSREDVCAKSGWICGICGKPINPKLRFPHRESATIDHIIPLAKGGADSLDNVQLAHMICNSIKSDNVLPVAN